MSIDPREPESTPPPPTTPPPTSEFVSTPDRPPTEDRTWAMVAHLAGVASSVLFPVIVSLVIYHVKRDESEFIADQAKEALNFQVTVILAALATIPLFLCGIGFLLLALVGLASLVFAIIGAIKAYDGERYRYPFTLRMF